MISRTTSSARRRALLDTHAFLWFTTGESRLTDTARELISDPRNEILLSMASLWEMAIKASSGKLVLNPSFDTAILGQMAHNDIRLLGIEVAHVREVLSLPWHHRDPFDRLLIAQAKAESLPVISVDGVFDSYPVSRIW
jgi:PIN domain nuclease of toxin-antitoxin system